MIFAIIKKEFIHIFRDPQSLVLILLLPLIILFLYSYAITFEMREIKTIVVDQSKTVQSRQLIDKISSSGFFKVKFQDLRPDQYEPLLQKRIASNIILIPANFTAELENKKKVDIQVLIDASDPNAANYINNYLSTIIQSYNADQNLTAPILLNLEPRFYYNPDLKSAYFFVPGSISVILLLISSLLTSMAIVREKEQHTMEQLLVSPVKPLQIVIGKVIPYIILGLIDGGMILIVGILHFKVPFLGSVNFLLLCMLLYISAGLMLGLLISTIANSLQVAMMATMLLTLLPTFLLSGFIFPIDSMPLIFRYVSKIVPATHFIRIIRGIMLKGAHFEDLVPQINFLIGFMLAMFFISVKKFNKNLS